MWITLWIIVSKLCISSLHSEYRMPDKVVCVCGLATYEETLVSESDTLWGE